MFSIREGRARCRGREGVERGGSARDSPRGELGASEPPSDPPFIALLSSSLFISADDH